ncbi:MAG: type I methionyl aminopeptidase [Ignavibacteriales bacterium]|nr:type I methionyl aminopeptidase [Ignavibacteriales bacterium]
MVRIKTEEQIALMRESSKIVADVLRLIGGTIKPGVSTASLDRMAEEFIRSCDAIPAFKGYGHDQKNLFPASLCISVDEQVVHGIPSDRQLCEGEIVSIDVGVKKNGYFGDGASTFAVGAVTAEKERLMRVTRESLMLGVAQAVEGNNLHDISAAVQKHVESAGFSVVRALVGHGIGTELHEDPPVPNYGKQKTGVLLKEGMALAIEPMVNYGTYKVRVAHDGWTVQTLDGKPSAHFEHTVIVRKGSAEILTV